MTTATLKAEWNKIKNRTGMYTSPDAAQQAGALLSRLSPAEAVAYAARFIGEDPTPGQYWVQVHTILTEATN